jgi:cytochrome c nitrite reductase small subunit
MRDVYDSWQNSSHHAVAKCVTCHLPHDFAGKWIAKARSGFNHSRAFTFQDFPEPIRISPHDARLVENNCIDCHQNTVAGMINSHVQNTASAQDRIECVRCHANVGHAGRR